jgi:hypothetical protein
MFLSWFQVGGTLIIREALVEDSGKYLCMVNNSVGGESVETVLTVTGAYYHQLSGPGFRIRITLTRIRIQLFTSMPIWILIHLFTSMGNRIRIQIFTSMRIRIQLFKLQCEFG